jgi:hypothetical protein
MTKHKLITEIKMFPRTFYERCASILNEKCVADKSLHPDFFKRDEWEWEDVKNSRSSCCTLWIHKGCSSDICSQCEQIMNKISDLESDLRYNHECNEAGCLLCKFSRIEAKKNKLDEKFANAISEYFNL